MHEKEIKDAAIGRIGADRMAIGLPCIPDRISGDLEMILAVRDENKKLKEVYNEIFENYIPTDKMDEANNRLILLLEDREQIGRDLLSKP